MCAVTRWAQGSGEQGGNNQKTRCVTEVCRNVPKWFEYRSGPKCAVSARFKNVYGSVRYHLSPPANDTNRNGAGLF